MSAPTVYVASTSRWVAEWLGCRDDWLNLGLQVVSSWIDEEGEPEDPTNLWVRCINEAQTADFLVASFMPGDVWKGAYVEIGAALSAGKPVYLCGRPPGSFIHHPLITLASDPDDAIEKWRAVHFHAAWPGISSE